MRISWIGSRLQNLPRAVHAAVLGMFDRRQLSALNTQGAEVRGRLDGVQRVVDDHRRQLGKTEQGIRETQQALVELESEMSLLSKQFNSGGMRSPHA